MPRCTLPPVVSSTPFDHRWHLRAELSRLGALLAAHITWQRNRERTAAGNAVQALVIEESEAGGLVAEIVAAWGGTPRRVVRPGPDVRAVIAEKAEAGLRQGASLPLRATERLFRLESHEYDALLLA